MEQLLNRSVNVDDDTSDDNHASNDQIQMSSPKINDNHNKTGYITITFLLKVEYDGTAFCGFQRQSATPTELTDSNIYALHEPFRRRGKNNPYRGQDTHKERSSLPLPSIQDALERALYQLNSARQSIVSFKVRSVGRTDKGVHAKEQMVCFDYTLYNMNGDIRVDTDVGVDFDNDECDHELYERKNCGGLETKDTPTSTSKVSPMKKKVKRAHKISKKTNYDDLFRKIACKHVYNINSNSEETSAASGKQKQSSLLLRKSFNSYLPNDVAVRSIRRCRTHLQPRQEACWKTYAYRIRYQHSSMDIDRTIKKGDINYFCDGGIHAIRTPFDTMFTWTCSWSLDNTTLTEMCKYMSGEHDFSSFVHKKDRKKKSNVMNIQINLNLDTEIEEEISIGLATIYFKSKDGFRRSMVRNLTGFLVDVSRGKYGRGKEKDFIVKNIFCSKDSSSNGVDKSSSDFVHASPACGLCLEKVDFINDVYFVHDNTLSEIE